MDITKSKFVYNIAFGVIIIVGVPTINALFQIVGVQESKYGLQFYRYPLVQALGWLLIGASIVILVAFNKSGKRLE